MTQHGTSAAFYIVLPGLKEAVQLQDQLVKNLVDLLLYYSIQ